MSIRILMLGMLLLGSSVIHAAEVRVAVLDFTLLDTTLLPNSPEELARTEAVAPLLRDQLGETAELALVSIPRPARDEANRGIEYLFEQAGATAALGRQFDADYVAVGRVQKPTHLFVFLKLRLIDVANERVIGDYTIELKGRGERMLVQGVERLARQIEASLRQQTAAAS